MGSRAAEPLAALVAAVSFGSLTAAGGVGDSTDPAHPSEGSGRGEAGEATSAMHAALATISRAWTTRVLPGIRQLPGFREAKLGFQGLARPLLLTSLWTSRAAGARASEQIKLELAGFQTLAGVSGVSLSLTQT